MFDWIVSLWTNYLSFLPPWLLGAIAFMFGFLLILAIWRVIS